MTAQTQGEKITKPAARPAAVAAAAAAGAAAGAAAKVAAAAKPAEAKVAAPAAEAKAAEPAAQPAAAPAQSFLPTRSAKQTRPPFDELTLLIFGKPGVGKTKFAAGNPQAYFLSLEPGQSFISAPVLPIKGWKDFQAHVLEVHKARKEKRFEFSTGILDIIDPLYDHCRDFVCKLNGVAYPPEDDFGKTWKAVSSEWQKWLRALLNSVNVVFLTHCTQSKREVTNEKGLKEELQVMHPTFAGNRAAQYLDGIVNAMGHIRLNSKGVRVISFKQETTVDAKDRTDVLAQMGEIELPSDPAKGWGVVAAKYNEAVKKAGFEIKSNWA